MNAILSPNSQAILLLTAPLIVGRTKLPAELLTPAEYLRLARHLHDNQLQPADLLEPAASNILQKCRPPFDEKRVRTLLERGVQLSQALEHWQARALWVLTRADADYPRTLRSRIRDTAPPVLYGCGDRALLDQGGLAVVGSRQVSSELLTYAEGIGHAAAMANTMVVSGGARGIDQAAMVGAVKAGGRSIGVLADSLERTAMKREYRNALLDGQLLMISPFDPKAGFHVGQAMYRNKLIYALSQVALVVNSEIGAGGTWAGATDQLEKFRFVPLYVRSSGAPSPGLDALREKGALPWPNPEDPDSFKAFMQTAALLHQSPGEQEAGPTFSTASTATQIDLFKAPR